VTRSPVAVDLDGALGDTRPLWEAWVESVSPIFELERSALPDDRGEAAAALDRRGAGNWRALLERFCEERAAVYLRREPSTSAALRALQAVHREIGIFTDAPEPLARIALAQLGADRRISALETGSGALDRLLERLGEDAVVVRTKDELLAASA
jgi:phosphoglycolate phosphatase-like HAD superfamily hydrolase